MHILSERADQIEEVEQLRQQLAALARANVHAAELMSQLHEAHELEALLVERNRELVRAQALERDRNRVLELLARNEPLDVVWDALARLSLNQDPGSAWALVTPRDGRMEVVFHTGHDSLNWMKELGGTQFRLRQADGVPTGLYPIRSAVGRVLGYLAFGDCDGAQSGQPELGEQLRMLAGIVLEQRRLYEQLAHQANHDSLTELPTRQLFHQQLNEAITNAEPSNRHLAVLWVDIDGFKQVNDTLGHRVGDTMLRKIAARLRECISDGETVARMGGDEFAILLPEVTGERQPCERARQIIEAVRAPVRCGEHDVQVTASVGISIYPEHGKLATVLIRNADAAMYSAKSAGKNGYELYSAGHAAVTERRLGIERRLRLALTNHEFSLVYQPQLRLDGGLFAMEALIRWKSPELGDVPPAEFIPIAEACGMILPLGDWVLREACRKGAEWASRGQAVRIAVNVSPLEFLRPDFAGAVMEALRQAHLAPTLLELELTETAIMRHPEQCATQLMQLRSAGVTVSIDDFGTGYSSLSRLQSLPIDCVKIDRSFIQRVDDCSAPTLPVVQAIIHMAESLGLRVIAEGVETEQQLQTLRDIGCVVAQGFLFHHPLPEKDADLLLAQRASTPAIE